MGFAKPFYGEEQTGTSAGPERAGLPISAATPQRPGAVLEGPSSAIPASPNQSSSARPVEVPSSNANVVVLCGKTPAHADYAKRIAEYLGAEVTAVSVAAARNVES